MTKILYKRLIKPIFFKQDPEAVHDRIIKLGGIAGRFRVTRFVLNKLFRYDHPSLETEVDGIKFQNPVGLSAGFDKDANLLNTLYHVGFGYMQVGSVTLNAYEGNPKPRLYRLPQSFGLVVYYGLKNIGVEKIISKVKKIKKNKRFPISFSIAKTNSTDTSTVEGGIEDYYQCMQKLVKADIGDIYTINISCPNTFGGEPYTTPEKLDKLLNRLSQIKTKKPRYVKMPVDTEWTEMRELIQVIIEHKFEGIILSNLTKNRESKLIKDEIPENVKGGISGKPTDELSVSLIKKAYKEFGDRLTIVGVGGIFSAEDAYKKIKAGSSLIQLITGMIYEGPQLIKDINKGLVKLLQKDGYKNISEAVGKDV